LNWQLKGKEGDMRDVFNRKKREIVIAILFCVVALFSDIKSYADEQKKEILVAKDVSLDHPVWCGDDTFLIVKKDGKLQVADLLENKKKIISNPHNVTLEACSSDGEWIIYSNRQSVRWDKDSYERGVIDFWRYSLKTGKRQKFAIAEDGSDIEISPNGTRFFFIGSKPKSFIKQPEPEWNLVWSKGSWKPTEVKWLKDSSSIVILSMNRLSEDKLLIEEPDKNSIRQFNIDLELIQNLRIDKSDRIYLLASPKPPTWPKIFLSDLKYRLLRCSIKGENLDCEDVLKRNKSIAKYDISSDGKKIIFIEGEGKTWKEKTCIWLFEEGNPEAKCITPSANINSIISISPDGKMMVFTDYREIKNGIYTNDLYLIKLTNE
jgi:Tol biopolymer transport system component